MFLKWAIVVAHVKNLMNLVVAAIDENLVVKEIWQLTKGAKLNMTDARFYEWHSSSPVVHFHDDDIWLQLPEFFSFLLSYLNLSIPLRFKKQ